MVVERGSVCTVFAMISTIQCGIPYLYAEERRMWRVGASLVRTPPRVEKRGDGLSYHLSRSPRECLGRKRYLIKSTPTESDTATTTSPTSPTSSSSSIRPACTLEDFEAVAGLRARAYYENDISRFRQTYEKQFKTSAVRELVKRNRLSTLSGSPMSICFVFENTENSGDDHDTRTKEGDANDYPDEGTKKTTIVASCELCPPYRSSGGVPWSRAPLSDPLGAFVLNVCVDQDHRRKGHAKELMEAAGVFAKREFGATGIYIQVDHDNLAALALYQSLGYEKVLRDKDTGVHQADDDSPRLGFERELMYHGFS